MKNVQEHYKYIYKLYKYPSAPPPRLYVNIILTLARIPEMILAEYFLINKMIKILVNTIVYFYMSN